jgi:hypothetical protein
LSVGLTGWLAKCPIVIGFAALYVYHTWYLFLVMIMTANLAAHVLGYVRMAGVGFWFQITEVFVMVLNAACM